MRSGKERKQRERDEKERGGRKKKTLGIASTDGQGQKKTFFLRTCPFSFSPPDFESTNRTTPTPARSTASRAASTAASEEAEEDAIFLQ